MLDVNLYGTSLCAHEAIKQMREVDDCGHIININSIAGHKLIDINPNFTNMYASSKYGVTAFTEILRQELRNNHSKIKVTVSDEFKRCADNFYKILCLEYFSGFGGHKYFSSGQRN